MATTLPLSTLLSQALVALTIELDTALELRLPHCTTATIKRRERVVGPWLVSYPMWANFLRFVPPEGIPAAEIQSAARTSDAELHIEIAGMTRWGYVTATPPAAAGSKRKPKEAELVIRPTAPGADAQALWIGLAPEIEGRWSERFGRDRVPTLKTSLAALGPALDVDSPPYLPVVTYATGLRAEVIPPGKAPPKSEPTDADRLELTALLSRVLLAFTLEFERRSDVSLAIAANYLRVLGGDGELTRDLPRVTGSSREAVTFATGWLQKNGYATIEPDADARSAKRVLLTDKGRAARDAYLRAVAGVEEGWTKADDKAVVRVREALEPLVGSGELATSPLAGGLVAPPGAWRADTSPVDTLPHHPLVLHRGGYPDGA